MSLNPLISDTQPQKRTSAFEAAYRHSIRVKWLRRGIILSSVLAIIFMASHMVYEAFMIPLPNIDAHAIGINGSKITIDHPQLSGFKKDGRAYRLVADTGVQDLKMPGIMELHNLNSTFDVTNGHAIVTAPLGIYDSKQETMDLSGQVNMRNDSGYDLWLKSAHISFKNNDLSSNEPSNLTMTSGTISSDKLQILEGGHHILFEGHVHSVTYDKDQNTLKGSKQ